MCILITEMIVELSSMQDLGFWVAYFLATDDDIVR